MWNINAPQGRISCAIIIKFAQFVTRFRTRYLLKFCWICSLGYEVMWVLSWRGLVIPKFSALPNGQTMRQIPNVFRSTRTCLRSSITMPSLVGLGFHPPPGWPKTLSFFVCLSVIKPWWRWRTNRRQTESVCPSPGLNFSGNARELGSLTFLTAGTQFPMKWTANGNAEFPTVPTGFQVFDKDLCNLHKTAHTI